MQEVPTWLIVTWLVISLLFFVANLVLVAVLAIIAIRIRPAVEDLTKKVGELTDKVEKVAERVEVLTANLGETVGTVGQRTTGILGSIEVITQSASRQFERFSPMIVGVMTAVRLVKTLSELRANKAGTPVVPTLAPPPANASKKKWLGLF